MISALAAVLGALEAVNTRLLTLGRSLSWICVAIMVSSILLQVFFRYVLDAPLSWSEELARMMMVWMTAFAAPSAYRWSGFVSIDMVRDALPDLLRRTLSLLLLLLALMVLIKLFELSLNFFERGFRSKMAGLWYPVFGATEGGGFGFVKYEKVVRAWVYLAMPVCFGTMLLVNVELVLREILRWARGDDAFPIPRPPFARQSAD